MAAENIPKCLNDCFGIPHDVRFLFEDNASDVKEVFAHKFVLSLASDVFKREFYGSMKESGEGIKIVDASQEVFAVMVEFIYNRETDWSTYNFNFLSSLYYLAEKYDVKKLKAKILVSIHKLKVTKENVMEVATVAEAYLPLPLLSNALYDEAIKCLENEFKGSSDSVFRFFSETEATQINSKVLHKLMARMSKPPSTSGRHGTLACRSCNTGLTNWGELNSNTEFRGDFGRAYLFNKVANLNYGKVMDRLMVTGHHKVRDVFCKICDMKLGWKYESAQEDKQKYKEGKFILEMKLVREY
eukprot:GFUD01037716.1.p1 GENE.GFUD01037716.1~~GFUD01037716.1.p1  ORF type:complete len:300 (-),score=79.98 GFUD01037716.1:61-960(-)